MSADPTDPLAGHMVARFNQAIYSPYHTDPIRMLRVARLDQLQAAGWKWDNSGTRLYKDGVTPIISWAMLAYAGTMIDWNNPSYVSVQGKCFDALGQWTWTEDMFVPVDMEHVQGYIAPPPCNHEYVNVSFNGLNMRCKHCDEAEPSKP